MPNSRKVFAIDYIEETVEAYVTILAAGREKDEGLISYAANVLNKYFQVVDLDNPQLKELSQKFYTINFQQAEKYPYKRKISEVSTIKIDGLKQLFKQRRSVRFYLNKPVERSLIEQAVDVASLSPSACNRQPFNLFIADKNPLKNELGKLPMGATNYYENVPVFIAIVGDLSAYFDERDRHLIYIDSSLFAMSFMLALETMGLASCPINWPDIESKEKQLTKILNLQPYQRCVMIIGVGFPDPESLIPYSNKKSSTQLIKYV